MSYKFCDREPCEGLKKALPRFLSPEWRLRHRNENLRIDVLDQSSQEPITVYLVYCPFCGTRLTGNEDVLEWVSRALGRTQLVC